MIAACPPAGVRTPETRLKEAETMVTIGVDSHKRTHTLVAINDVGKKLAERTLAATPEGHLDALAWAGRWPQRRSSACTRGAP